MTRNAIINEYFERNFSGKYITIEDLVKSKKMSKKELIEFCKKECIFYHHGFTKEQIQDRVIGSISHMIYAMECCKK